MKFLQTLVLCFLVNSCQFENDQESQFIWTTIDVSNSNLQEVETVLKIDSNLIIFDSQNQLFLIEENTRKLIPLKLQPYEVVQYFTTFDNTIAFRTKADSIFKIVSLEPDLLEAEYVCSLKDFDCWKSFNYPAEFTDENFVLSSCCVGEWGGAVFFKHRNGKINSFESTCVVDIDTFQNDYYIFNYLGHLRGNSGILKVGDVNALKEIDPDTSEFWCNWYYSDFTTNDYPTFDSIINTYLGDTTANKIIFDTLGLKLLSGYVDESGVFILYDSENHLKMGKVANTKIEDEFVIIDTIKGFHTVTLSGVSTNRDVFFTEFWENKNFEKVKRNYIIDISTNFRQGKLFILDNEEKPYLDAITDSIKVEQPPSF